MSVAQEKEAGQAFRYSSPSRPLMHYYEASVLRLAGWQVSALEVPFHMPLQDDLGFSTCFCCATRPLILLASESLRSGFVVWA